jgi:hypothetical protein
MRTAGQARTLNFDGIVGSPISPGAASTVESGIISIAWHGHCSKQTAQPVQRS